MQGLTEEALLEKLQTKTGKSKAELETLAEEKTQKFAGLLSKEAALFLLAKEAGAVESQALQLPAQPIPINQLQAGQSKVDVIAVAKQIFPVKEYANKNKPGTGKRASILLADQTGEIFVTFWQQDTEKLNAIPTGTILLLRNLSVNSYNGQTQLSFGYKSSLEQNPKQAKTLSLPPVRAEKKQLTELSLPAFGIHLEGILENLEPEKTFQNQQGEEGKLQRFSFRQGDEIYPGVAWNEKTNEISQCKVGQTILLENTRAKQGWKGQTELSVDKNTRIVITDATPVQEKSDQNNEL